MSAQNMVLTVGMTCQPRPSWATRGFKMAELPLEIMFKIISFVDDREILLSLSLTCQALSAEIMARLRSVLIQLGQSKSSTAELERRRKVYFERELLKHITLNFKHEFEEPVSTYHI
ncbi:hypothetical protein N7539_003806 [Penicillium diatomitis]|uniref:F-box domain-containing protein n=1 Tax=Penicillium diatomitis TaxID=2819901 RepID=A0A9W9XCS8_9EURO|nr:uncharacterized protein N7539_003806 [Penicillium diatomitis]KAJ5488916.1 hypothetical protein N7539_003806 [Penicillium diatomitis]